jgi:hypothetical protein
MSPESAASIRHLRVLAGASVEDEYGSDTWDAHRLGIAARRGRGIARFGVIWVRLS